MKGGVLRDRKVTFIAPLCWMTVTTSDFLADLGLRSIARMISCRFRPSPLRPGRLRSECFEKPYAPRRLKDGARRPSVLRLIAVRTQREPGARAAPRVSASSLKSLLILMFHAIDLNHVVGGSRRIDCVVDWIERAGPANVAKRRAVKSWSKVDRMFVERWRPGPAVS